MPGWFGTSSKTRRKHTRHGSAAELPNASFANAPNSNFGWTCMKNGKMVRWKGKTSKNRPPNSWFKNSCDSPAKPSANSTPALDEMIKELKELEEEEEEEPKNHRSVSNNGSTGNPHSVRSVLRANNTAKSVSRNLQQAEKAAAALLNSTKKHNGKYNDKNIKRIFDHLTLAKARYEEYMHNK